MLCDHFAFTYRKPQGLTIIHRNETSIDDPAAVALNLLGWVLSDPRRAQRFLDLTGLTPETLRANLAREDTYRAVFEFVSGHEPDLLEAATALDMSPQAIITAAGAIA